MQTITIKNGKEIKVDDEDYEQLIKHRWHDNGNGYIRSHIKENGKDKHWLIHRYIIEKLHKINIPKDKLIDHINTNVLDNRKNNLRIVSNKINCLNKKTNRIPDGFLSSRDALLYLGYKTETSLYYLRKKNKLKKYKVRGTACYKQADLDKLLKPKPS